VAETALELAGEGTVRSGFRLSGYGWVVLLEEKFSGNVRAGCILESSSGRATVKGVEIAHGYEGTEVQGWPGLLIDESAKSFFEAGQPVKLYKQR